MSTTKTTDATDDRTQTSQTYFDRVIAETRAFMEEQNRSASGHFGSLVETTTRDRDRSLAPFVVVATLCCGLPAAIVTRLLH